RAAPARAAARGGGRGPRPRRRDRRRSDRWGARGGGRLRDGPRRERVAAARSRLRLEADPARTRRARGLLSGRRDANDAEAAGNAVEARDLFRLYASPEGTSVALQGLTLDVAVGELLVVFGPSGSGKSTLLRILAGLDRPSVGSVSVFGHDLRTLRGRALVEYRSRALGYADQHCAHALAPELNVRQLVALRLALLGVERAERERAADSLLERVGLLDRADALPRELSGGQQQR